MNKKMEYINGANVEELTVDGLTPTQYFNELKSKISEYNDEELSKYYTMTKKLYDKYRVLNQTRGAAKLLFNLKCVSKELVPRSKGFNKVVLKSDVLKYIEEVSDKVVKLIDLKDYTREVPDEAVDIVVQFKGVFDRFIIVTTDYTGKLEREVEQVRRDKDPILFGAFVDSTDNTLSERLYFLYDWEDEYCHLTLEKMVDEMKDKLDIDIVKIEDIPKTNEDLIREIENNVKTSTKSNNNIDTIIIESNS